MLGLQLELGSAGWGENMIRFNGRYAALFLTYVCLSTPAFAYLDGATASIVLQAIIGGVATWMVYSRSLVAKGKAFFANRRAKDDQSPRSE